MFRLFRCYEQDWQWNAIERLGSLPNDFWWFLAEMMLEEKTRITGWKAWPQSAQDTCRSKEGWLALLCANPYPKSQSVVFIQTLAGFDFWDVEDYGRLVAVCDTSVPFWSWQVHFLGLKVSVHGKRLDPKSMRRDPHCFCSFSHRCKAKIAKSSHLPSRQGLAHSAHSVPLASSVPRKWETRKATRYSKSFQATFSLERIVVLPTRWPVTWDVRF